MSETLYLPAHHFATLKRLLQLYLPNAEIWAFGSRVKGTHWEASDIDLVARAAENMSLSKELTALQQALSESACRIWYKYRIGRTCLCTFNKKLMPTTK